MKSSSRRKVKTSVIISLKEVIVLSKKHEAKIVSEYLVGNNNRAYGENSFNNLPKIFLGDDLLLINFESPDIIIESPNIIYGFEHYEIFSAKRINKSNSQKKEQSSLMNDIFRKGLSFSEDQVAKRLKSEVSIDHYKNNLVHISDKHFRKMDQYIKNIEDHNAHKKVIEMGVFIENQSIVNDTFLRDGKHEVLLPWMIKEFVHLLSEYETIRHIFYLYENSKGKNTVYFYNSNSNREELKSNDEFILNEVLDDFKIANIKLLLKKEPN